MRHILFLTMLLGIVPLTGCGSAYRDIEQEDKLVIPPDFEKKPQEEGAKNA